MSDIQIKPPVPVANVARQIAEDFRREPRPKSARRSIEQVEKLDRCFAVKDAAESLVLDDSLRPSAEMAKIGEAHAVDPGRVTALPAPPDQPRHVEQEGGVVGHWRGSKHASWGMQTGARRAVGRTSQEPRHASTRPLAQPNVPLRSNTLGLGYACPASHEPCRLRSPTIANARVSFAAAS